MRRRTAARPWRRCRGGKVCGVMQENGSSLGEAWVKRVFSVSLGMTTKEEGALTPGGWQRPYFHGMCAMICGSACMLVRLPAGYGLVLAETCGLEGQAGSG